jgi:ABC-type tungstate transport system substrate-binding protein
MAASDQPIVVVDLRISFWRLMMFFIKAALAAIPAAIIVGFIIMVVTAGVAVLLGGSPHFVMRQWTF